MAPLYPSIPGLDDELEANQYGRLVEWAGNAEIERVSVADRGPPPPPPPRETRPDFIPHLQTGYCSGRDRIRSSIEMLELATAVLSISASDIQSSEKNTSSQSPSRVAAYPTGTHKPAPTTGPIERPADIASKIERAAVPSVSNILCHKQDTSYSSPTKAPLHSLAKSRTVGLDPSTPTSRRATSQKPLRGASDHSSTSDSITTASSLTFSPSSKRSPELSPTPATPSTPVPASPSTKSPTYLLKTGAKKKIKWYAVVVGRRTGVFDQWGYTNALVTGVPGNNYEGFSTEEEAQQHYSANRHLSEVVRTYREDEAKFGPVGEARDVNWRGY